MADPEPGANDDGRYVTIDGRRWRATDPNIPDGLRQQLVGELMAARRAVRAAAGDDQLGAARGRVHDAKVALGERGEPWWEAPTPDGRRARLAAATRALLRRRGTEKTACPSEIARIVASPDWRSVMDDVRAVAADLADDGVLDVVQGGEPVDHRADVRGPIRYRWRDTGCD